MESSSPTPARWAVIAGFAVIYLVWGANFLAIRIAVQSIPPLLMVGTRFIIAGLILYLWARGRGAPPPASRQWGGAALIGCMLLVCDAGAVAWAEQTIPSGLVSLLVATVPIWMVLIETFWERGRRFEPRVAIGVLAGFAGVALLLRPSFGAAGSARSLGIWIVLGGAVAWSFGSIYTRHVDRPDSQILTMGMQMLMGGVILVVGGLCFGEAESVVVASISTASLLAFIYLLVVGSLIAFPTYLWLLQVAPPSRVATYAYVNPVVALLLGWTLGGETIDAGLLAGAIVILGSVALILGPPRR